MNTLKLSAGLLAAGLLVGAPAFAQSDTDSSKPKPTTAQKQKTDGNSPTEVGPGSAAYKQRTQGLPAGTSPPVYGSDWAKKHE